LQTLAKPVIFGLKQKFNLLLMTMKLILSPAKSLDFKKEVPSNKKTIPVFGDEAAFINAVLKEKTAKGLGQLMSLSEALAELNWNRNQQFILPSTEARAAVFAFNGDVYSGLDAYSLSEEKMESMQNKLRILSGLYGLLRPFDEIKPYRLEMGTSLKLGKHKNLYSFWKTKITDQLNAELEDGELLVNLASKEYFSAVDAEAIQASIVTPHFKDFKNGKLKIISFFAKKARGMMARYLLEQKATTLEDLKGFSSEGYAYSEEESLDSMNPVFIR
jgi:cytoplasmic iron level regulating protein YaaA (DUF328/UPF0246 family)